MRNHYYTLGLSENASPEEIKSAFKRLAVKYHPDKHMGNVDMEEKFKSVNEAYQILSDPYKRAQFDLQLQYYRFQQSSQQTHSRASQSYHYEPPTRRYGGRPYYRPRPINHKENNRATLYAFAITLGIALVVMVIKGIYDMYLQNKYEEHLAERRTEFNRAKELYDQNELRSSLLMLSDMSPFLSEERDMNEFKVGVLEEIMFKGEENYIKKDFANAVRYYELVEQFSPYYPASIKARLARSYRFVDQPEKSIYMLKKLIESNYKVVETLVQISEVYDEELNDSDMAIDYLELARDVAINDYRARFGNAYMVVVTAEFLPYDHYYLYQNLANLYNRMEQPEKSLGATNWMKRIWVDSTQAWVIAGKSYEMMGQRYNACREYRMASEMGYPEPLPQICR